MIYNYDKSKRVKSQYGVENDYATWTHSVQIQIMTIINKKDILIHAHVLHHKRESKKVTEEVALTANDGMTYAATRHAIC